ncbi:DUF397 domain-containing protein [Actinosynnema sp. NPDC050436]|uniref:DUF397 domain-containing protein n=1 Tax=Actinosynnema sp. NPDC050436 TaxID=3155659 RepID=UPI0033E6FA4A
MTDTGWFKSSYSTAGNDNCVEVRLTRDHVGVRDSKNPHGDALRVPLGTWDRLLDRLS